MSITDELREWAARELASWKMARERYDALTAIADRIDAEHERAMAAAALIAGVPIGDENMAEHGWVKLPVSEDGDVLHIGELVDETFGGYAAPAPIDTMELSRGANGYVWMVKLDAENRALISPKLLRHYHAPTVEDVLREMADRIYADEDEPRDRDAIVAEYARRLQLREVDE